MEQSKPQHRKPAEYELLTNLESEQLRLVANWLREELTLYAEEYDKMATRSQQRIEFIVNRLENAADKRDNNEPIPTVNAPTADPGVEDTTPWRFSDEYWEKYEKDSD